MKSAASELAASTRSVSRGQDYLALLKPRVMTLVVFTAFTGLVCAGAPIDRVHAATAIVCIVIAAGASGALSMWYDADIDRLMEVVRCRRGGCRRQRRSRSGPRFRCSRSGSWP